MKIQKSTYTSANKSFPGFLWTELNQWGPSKEKSEHISHDIVDDDHHDGHDEPDKTFKHILKRANQLAFSWHVKVIPIFLYLYDKVRLCHHNQKSNVGPCKKRELSHVVFLDQGEHKPDKAHDVHGERDESMVADQKGQDFDSIDEDTKVIDEGFTIKEIVWSHQKVPWQRSKPRQVVDPVHRIAYVDNFRETLDLNTQRLKGKIRSIEELNYLLNYLSRLAWVPMVHHR